MKGWQRAIFAVKGQLINCGKVVIASTRATAARRAIPTRATDMAKGLVRDMVTAAMAIKRGDA